MLARVAGSGVRLAELMAALSMATDLGMGQPLESALSSCVVAMRLGEALGLDDQTMRDVYYQALLRYIGCNADTHALAAIFGDELVLAARLRCGRPRSAARGGGTGDQLHSTGERVRSPRSSGSARLSHPDDPARDDARELRWTLRSRPAAGRASGSTRFAHRLPGSALRTLGR